MSCPSVELQPGQVWTDWLHEQGTTAGRLRPRCREALVRWLAARPDLGRLRVKAVGAGHSTSGVARPRGGTGVFVDLSQLELEPQSGLELGLDWRRALRAGRQARLGR